VRTRVRRAAPILLVALAAGCGHARRVSHAKSPKPDSVCLPRARIAIGRALSAAAQSVAVATSTGNNGEPQCTFAVLGRRGARLTVNVDSEPQPYYVLERTVVEATQITGVGAAQPVSPPQHIGGLGLDADWFPTQQKLMTTNGVRLFTVYVIWPGASVARRKKAAETAARAYLGRLHYHVFH
jgi:hypothetical protein